MLLRFGTLVAVMASASSAYQSELMVMEGHTVFDDYEIPLPHTYTEKQSLPDEFSWADQDGNSCVTHSLNQHIPQYCGSCWAHGALSALADRIKIARGCKGDEINLSIQYILNCGGSVAGSCHGGYSSGVYEFIKSHSGSIPYDTCMPYVACSAESTEGFCKHVDTTCSKKNTCRTCSTFSSHGGTCAEIDEFPNATIAEYGTYSDKDIHKIMSEIHQRGPVAANINASPIHSYKGGVFTDKTASRGTNHVVSIIGWGLNKETGKKYWIIRNSWGQYWGELGYIRVEMGSNILGVESVISWATPKHFTTKNLACNEDGSNCGAGSHHFVDPFHNIAAAQRSLRAA